MKIVLVLYLEEDGPAVTKLLADQGIHAYSRLPMEGHGEGRAGGWYGDIAMHDSKMIFTIIPDEEARSLIAAVKQVSVHDTSHPIRAAQLGVESWVSSSG
jgi:hypothetical protein